MKRILPWISKMLSEGDGSPSTKRVLFAIAVLAAITFCGIELYRHGLAGCVDLMKATLLTTGGAYGVGRFAEQRESEPPKSPTA